MTLETPWTSCVNMAPCSTGFIQPSWCGRNHRIVCRLQNMASSVKTAESTLVGPKRGSKKSKKIFLSLMRGSAKLHGFLHIGAHLVAKGALGHMGQIPHAFRENWQKFQNEGFPAAQVGFGVDARPEHPGDTSHTSSARCCRLPIRPVLPRSPKHTAHCERSPMCEI